MRLGFVLCSIAVKRDTGDVKMESIFEGQIYGGVLKTDR